MSIVRGRIHFSDNFTIMSNAWVRDERLTLRARGLLLHLLSHREGWTLTVDQLVKVNPEGKDAIRTALKELEQHGYLRREQSRGVNAKFGNMDYVLMDPEENPQVKPLTENPPTAGPPHKNTNPKNTTLCYDDPAGSSRKTGATTEQAPPRTAPKRDKWGILEEQRRPVRDAIVRLAHQPYRSEGYEVAFQDFRGKLAEVYGEDFAGYADNKWSVHARARSPKGAGTELNTLIATAMAADGLPAPVPPW